jgi:hypothetical protein
MPAGQPYFAWVDASETAFGPEHMRWDESVFSFTLSQDEGDPASLTAVVRRPVNVAGDAIGLLGPGRKIWAWFALDCGPGLVKFRGRLVGIPTSIFEELVTLEFVAKPVDVVAQKEALANSLRVLPYYDEAVIDEARRSDPDVVLEGYTKIWAFDPVTHIVSVSDEITGEDGLVEFDGASEDGKVLYDGLGLTLESGPLSRVDVIAEYTWTQQARGSVDLTDYLISNWPGAINGQITFSASDWPKRGAGLGDGWEVTEAFAQDLINFTVSTKTGGSTNIVKYADGTGHTTTFQESSTFIAAPSPTLIAAGPTELTEQITVNYAEDGDGNRYQSSYSRNVSRTSPMVGQQAIKPTLLAGYEAARNCTERIAFSLFADVQSILTDPEDGEALRIDDVKSVNLTEGGMIGDPRRRSYIATERGNQSLEHLIALARAHLMKRARVVQIAFAPKLSRMVEVTLRKNAFLIEPRVGEALGKIVGYSISLDGSDGRINCEMRIGCTIGRGGSAVASGGEPTYASVDYVGADYQQFTGRTVLFDASVGYEPPNAGPNDDGVDFLGNVSAADVIEVPLVVTIGPDPEDAELPPWEDSVAVDDGEAKAEYTRQFMKQFEVHASFKLKSMTRDFSTDYEVQVTDVKIPTGIDLEAA